MTSIVRQKETCNYFTKRNIGILIFFLKTTVFFSCQTSPQKILSLVKDQEEPTVVSKEVDWFYTKNGVPSHRLTSPQVLRFESHKEYLEFPLGLKVFSFNDYGEQEAFMRSDYAIQYLDDKTIKANGDVLLENSKGEKLETESLVWDQKQEKIFTKAFVRITKQGQLIIGDGFESNTSFSKYTLKNSRGIINLDQPE